MDPVSLLYTWAKLSSDSGGAVSELRSSGMPLLRLYRQLSLGSFLSSSLASLTPHILLELLRYLCLLKGFFMSGEVMPVAGGRRKGLFTPGGSWNMLVHGCLAWVECLWGCANYQE